MCEWSVEASAEARATMGEIWELWADVAAWPKWDRELEWANLEGDFRDGATGSLKPKGWPVSKFCITISEKGRSFTCTSKLPFTKMIFIHSVAACGEGRVKITHRARIKGLLAPLLFLTLRRNLKRGLLQAVQTLARGGF